MGSRKIFITRPNLIYPTTEISESDNNNMFEFDESEVWNTNESISVAVVSSMEFHSRKPLPTSKKFSKKKNDSIPSSSSSLPVSIPDWSKILKQEYRGHAFNDDDHDDEVNGYDTLNLTGGGGDGCGGGGRTGNIRIPPHEYLARRRGDSLSVHEGIGRTLKGRDLRRVRNAIWKRTGFED